MIEVFLCSLELGILNYLTIFYISGGCASVVGQTCIVPFDVISQHMMVVGMQQPNGKGGG